jgi:hypothetical protein
MYLKARLTAEFLWILKERGLSKYREIAESR